MNEELLNYFQGDELAASTWLRKYAANGEKTPDDMHKRMAKEFARIENEYKDNNSSRNKVSSLSTFGQNHYFLTEDKIYNLFKDFKYIIPGGSVMSGCGTNELVSLSNCFVIDSPKDSYSDLMDTRNRQVQLMKRRGGVGYDLSKLRPRGAKVNNAAKTSTGAASFMEVCSDITNEVAQNGRRGALMLSLSINHPDIEEFITKKQDLTKVTGANISVKVTNDFMLAVKNNQDYFLRFPINQDLSYFSKEYLDIEYNKLTYLEDPKNDNEVIYVKRIKAKELWDKLIYCAWNTAEPGIMFEDTMHNYAPDGVYPEYRMVSTNPCGEIPMGGMDSCRLIHINLTSVVINPFKEDSKIDESLLYEVTYYATKIGDSLIDLEIEQILKILSAIKNNAPIEKNLWERIYDITAKGRRAGIGFTGLADVLAMLNLKYDSQESMTTIHYIMSIIFKAQLDCEIDMAIMRSPFEAYNDSLEYPNDAPSNDWFEFVQDNFYEEYLRMRKYGRRNISFSTVAPTGTVSIMAGTSSGIEPVFMPFYERKVKCTEDSQKADYIDKVGEKYNLHIVVHKNLQKYADIIGEDTSNWSITDWDELYKRSPYFGSIAPDISWKNRVMIQSIVQEYITHSISSTINLPKETTVEEISSIYINAWEFNNKGQTIYRDGSREGVLNKVEKPSKIEGRQAPKRPKELEADYYQIKAKGELFIVLVGLLDGKPYEIFAFRPKSNINIPTHKGIITKNKKMHYGFKSDYLQISDLQLANSNIEEKAATLYSSMLLRHGVNIEYIIKTAKKVNDNISSFSSALCRVLSKYINSEEVKGEICPECGGRLQRDGGCIHCIDCSWSKCM